MKKFFWVLLVSFCGCSGAALAQNGVGFRGGPLLSQLTLEYVATVQTLRPRQLFVNGYDVGVVGRFMNTKHLGLQVEANYVRQGWHIYPETVAEQQRVIEMIQLPILSYLQIGRGRFKFTVQAGAFAGYIFNQEDVLVPEGELPANMIRNRHQEELPWQYGILGGGGPSYQFPFGTLQLDARYAMAMSDLIEIDFTRTDDFDAFRLQTITFGLQWVYMF